MNSKTIVVIALSSLFMTAPYAASQENASIEVSYTASTANFRQGGNSRPNRYILLANAHDSKFYSPMTEYLDSLQSTPEGDARYKDCLFSTSDAADE